LGKPETKGIYGGNLPEAGTNVGTKKSPGALGESGGRKDSKVKQAGGDFLH